METVVKAEVIKANGSGKYVWFIEQKYVGVMCKTRFKTAQAARVSMKAYMKKKNLQMPEVKTMRDVKEVVTENDTLESKVVQILKKHGLV